MIEADVTLDMNLHRCHSPSNFAWSHPSLHIHHEVIFFRISRELQQITSFIFYSPMKNCRVNARIQRMYWPTKPPSYLNTRIVSSISKSWINSIWSPTNWFAVIQLDSIFSIVSSSAHSNQAWSNEFVLMKWCKITYNDWWWLTNSTNVYTFVMIS